TTRGLRPASSRSRHCWVTISGARALVRRTWSASSKRNVPRRSMGSVLPWREYTPALLIRRSRASVRRRTAAWARRMESGSATSRATTASRRGRGAGQLEREDGRPRGGAWGERLEVPGPRRLPAGGEDPVAALEVTPGELEAQAAPGAGDEDAPGPARAHSRGRRETPWVGIASAPGAALTTVDGRAPWVGIRSSCAAPGVGAARAGRGPSAPGVGRRRRDGSGA